jgi:hypothetical protein
VKTARAERATVTPNVLRLIGPSSRSWPVPFS